MIEPYYSEDGIVIYNEDCRLVLPQLTEKVDLVLTDPPYGVDKANWDGFLPLDWYFLAQRVTDRFLLCVGNSNIPIVARALPDYCQLIILRNKNGMQSTKFSFDNFIPCFQMGGGWQYRQTQNVIDFSINGEKPDHPSPKPIEAILKLVNDFSDEDETILDPFLGSGTTAVAAKRLGRKCIGIEISEAYCEIAVNRLRQMELFGSPTEGK